MLWPAGGLFVMLVRVESLFSCANAARRLKRLGLVGIPQKDEAR